MVMCACADSVRFFRFLFALDSGFRITFSLFIIPEKRWNLRDLYSIGEKDFNNVFLSGETEKKVEFHTVAELFLLEIFIF